MTISEMKQRQQELGYTDEQLSLYSGVPLDTICKIFAGTPHSLSDIHSASDAHSTPDTRSASGAHSDTDTRSASCTHSASNTRSASDYAPSSDLSTMDYETWIALEQTLGKWSQSMIAEAAPDYKVKRQGEYTLEDYYKIPEEHRVELIDGVIYDMEAPTSVHQIITAALFSMLFTHNKNKKGSCLPMISPLDVQLDCDDRTMVQPDIIIVCDRSKIINRCVYGAPDFIAEVISPSSRRKDMIVKLNKYLNAQVREYWLIDPIRRKVTVYDFEHDEFPVIYGFDAKIPVQIWNGEFEVDFEEIYEDVKFLYERKEEVHGK